MLIHEIVLQGVPGSPGMSRLPVGQGMTVLAPVAGQPLPLVRLLTQILFDESVEPPADLNLRGSASCRAGLTLQDAAGRVYRIVRDLQRGSVQLLTLDPATQAFSQVSNRPAEVGQFLRAQAQVPAEDLIREIFSLQASDAPSRQVLVTPTSTPSPTSPFEGLGTGSPGGRGLGGRTMTPPGGTSAGYFPGHAGDSPPSDPGAALASGPMGASEMDREEAQRRLADLEAQIASAAEIDDLQFELDGLQQKIDGIDTALAATRELETQIEGLDQKLVRFADLEDLPADFSEKVRGYARAAERRDRALERVDSEQDSYSELAAIPPVPLLRSPLFMGGFAGIAAILLMVLGLDLRLLASLLPLSLGAVAIAVLIFFDDREDRAGLQRRVGSLEERRAKAERSFELETSLVRRTMERLGVDSPEDLIARLDELAAARGEQADARSKLAALRDTPEHAGREAERAGLQAQVDAIEERLGASGGYAEDPADMRREMEGLRAIVAGESSSVSGAEPTFGGLGGGSFSATPPGMPGLPALPQETPAGSSGAGGITPVPGPANPGPRILALLTDITHRRREEILPMLGPRLAQYVAALSQGRWRGASFVGRGDLQVDEATGPSIAWDALTPSDRDLLHLGLRLAAAELSVRQGAVPLVFDEPLLGNAPQALVQKMLLALATVTQVILQSSDPAWQVGATTVHRLGS